MIESQYKGSETLEYKQADFAELKYIKIIYKDMDDVTHEFKTETNFLSDSYLSIFVKRTKSRINKVQTDEAKTAQENRESAEAQNSICTDYLKKLAEIRAAKEMIGENGELDDYNKKMEEIKLANEKEQEVKHAEEEPEDDDTKGWDEEELKQFEVECPQEVMLKFVIGELLYVAKAELKEIKIKPTKVYFRIKAPEIL